MSSTKTKNNYHSRSSSLNSSNSQQNLDDFEKDKLFLKKALETNDTIHTFEKINKNISSFCSNIQLLQDYSLCLGSKQDNKEKGMEIEKTILDTGDEIAETFDLIEIIKNFEYKEKNQKIENITKANRLEDECNKYKKMFDDLTEEIKQQNINIITQARTSVRFSNLSDFSGEIHLENDEPINNNIGFQNGKEFIEGIEMKRKQNDAINKAAIKIKNTLSKKNIVIMNLKDNDDNNHNKNTSNDYNDDNQIEIFNVEYNKKKNELQNALLPNNNFFNTPNNEDSKFMSLSNHYSSRTSKAFKDMEEKVFIALEGNRQNFIRRHWLIFLFIIIIIATVVYFMFFKK